MSSLSFNFIISSICENTLLSNTHLKWKPECTWEQKIEFWVKQQYTTTPCLHQVYFWTKYRKGRNILFKVEHLMFSNTSLSVSHHILQPLVCHTASLAFEIRTESFPLRRCLQGWRALKKKTIKQNLLWANWKILPKQCAKNKTKYNFEYWNL